MRHVRATPSSRSQPGGALRQQPAHLPEPPQRRAEPQARLGVLAVLDRPGEGRAQVVVLAVEHVEQPLLVRAGQARSGSLGQWPGRRRHGARPIGLGFARLDELLEGEFADREQHREARLAVGLVLADQALVDEAGQAVEHVASPASPHTASAAAQSSRRRRRPRSARTAAWPPASSRSWLQAMAPRSVCWRGRQVARPRPEARRVAGRAGRGAPAAAGA